MARPPSPAADAMKPGRETDPEPRTSRRKRKTRTRLLRAALELMADRGMEGVAINEITEAADVGFGTFYNYFDAKEAIHDALVEEVVGSFGAALDQVAEHADDPAEIFAASVRYTLRRAGQEPLWGRFLVRSGFSARALEQGLGPRMLRDLKQGIAASRFRTSDLPMTVVAVRGAVLSAIDAQVELAQDKPSPLAFAVSLGLDRQSVPERTAAILLRLLGLDTNDAKEVANRPLPEIDLP